MILLYVVVQLFEDLEMAFLFPVIRNFLKLWSERDLPVPVVMIPKGFNRFVGEMHVTGSHRSQSVKNEACTQIALWRQCSNLTSAQQSELFSLGQRIKDGPSLKRKPRSSSSVI